MDLEVVERDVQRAIRARSYSGLTMLDRGDIRMVFVRPAHQPVLALKRLKRVQGPWKRLTGRRYESLIPEHTTYETAR